ncbi:MAG: pyridoxamine 5'-phosphate oxidase [Phycisphaeraceae bacterium]|nr:pyridoxamine 5'-phosphate oxidase [Phycisphaeraceae bacterium]
MIDELLTSLLVTRDLPDPPPPDPLPLLKVWYEEARACGKYDDFNAMSLATATATGVPSVRIVLCKSIDHESARVVFFTNYESRKGRELASNPHAAAVFHWPHAKRQVRIEGAVVRVTPEESDAYFATRPLLSRIGAHVSPQSRPIKSRSDIIKAAKAFAGHLVTGESIKRPDWWGGFAINITAVELWSSREARLHHRIRWQREGTSLPARWTSDLLAP